MNNSGNPSAKAVINLMTHSSLVPKHPYVGTHETAAQPSTHTSSAPSTQSQSPISANPDTHDNSVGGTRHK